MILKILERWDTLEQTPETYAVFDWNIHHQLAVSSENPVFPLMLNGFEALYHWMGLKYFSLPGAYALSNYFYGSLYDAIVGWDAQKAELVCVEVMARSEKIWDQLRESTEQEEKI